MRDDWRRRIHFIQPEELEMRKRDNLEGWFPMEQWARKNENAGLAVHRALREGYEVRTKTPYYVQPRREVWLTNAVREMTPSSA